MLKKSYLKLTVLLVLPVMMLGCDSLFEDHASKFNLGDANQVEWAPPNPASVNLAYTASLTANQTDPKTVELKVQLIGAQTGSDRSAGVAVGGTDGEEGTQFELLSNEVVIPANSSFGTVEVRIHAENIANGESFSATLELQEGPELDVAVNMKDLNLSVQKASQ